MEHNTNQNSNYLALLNLADDGEYNGWASPSNTVK